MLDGLLQYQATKGLWTNASNTKSPHNYSTIGYLSLLWCNTYHSLSSIRITMGYGGKSLVQDDSIKAYLSWRHPTSSQRNKTYFQDEHWGEILLYITQQNMSIGNFLLITVSILKLRLQQPHPAAARNFFLNGVPSMSSTRTCHLWRGKV